MSPSAEHEKAKDTITLLVNVWAEENEIDITGLGSTTFRREDLARGFKPDACFYIQAVDLIRSKTDLSLDVDPLSDLVIEIDITSSSLNKLSILGQIGVLEVWRFMTGNDSVSSASTGKHTQNRSQVRPYISWQRKPPLQGRG